ncbi:MAG TPA: trypsin-like peptidase domain-containing protein [Usitatibacter sp.]|nr:trypsin-like peptidase domain-containing protein [Usitatibacter sp.]
MASPKKSLYEILGVPRDANDLDIGIAHQRRVAELQRAAPPDPNGQVLVHEAFEVLSNPKRRAAYDASLLSAAEKAAAREQAAAPDIVLEGGEEPPPDRRKLMAGVAAALVVAVVAAIAVGMHGEKPAPAPVAEAPRPAPPPPPQKLSSAQILAATLKSVGPVMSYEMSGRAVPVGLALSVQPDSMVTTCHGIHGNSQLVVRVGADSHSATLDVTDEVLDLCRMAIPGLAARSLAIAPDEPRAGDTVYALGANPAGEVALTEGKVKSIRATPNGRVIELSMPVAPAGSGGAVLDEYGHLVGVATTSHKLGAGLNIALPASWLAQMRTRNAQAS